MLSTMAHFPPFRRPGTRPGRVLAVAFAVVCWTVGAASVAASLQDRDREEILSYDVTVALADHGSMEVTEEIRVRALGQEIRRGIYRDFPTSFPRASGLGRIVAPFEVLSVERDGQPERYDILSVGGPARRGGIRVRVGHPDRTLTTGEYAYVIRYRTARWVDFGAESDALYWNVTGNGWAFPIESASVRVLLPGTVRQGDIGIEAWTGPEGSTESHAATTVGPALPTETVVGALTTRPLGAREGLTVRVTFPKDVVAPPTEAQRAEWFRMDWGSWIDGAMVVALVLAFYLLMWRRVGVDPAPGPTVVRYEPPEGFSAAALGFVRDRGFRPRHLTAGVVGLAVKGALTVERKSMGTTWDLERTRGGHEPLTSDEQVLLKGLFPTGALTRIGGSSNPVVRSAVKAFRDRLSSSLERHYFVTNRRWFAAGLAVSATLFAALVWRARFGVASEAWFLAFWLTFWTMGTATLVYRVVRLWIGAIGGQPLLFVGAMFLTLFSLPFVGAEIFVGYLLWERVPEHLVMAAVALGAVNVAFYHLLERPTLRGRGVLDALEGFRRFLLATDEDRYDRLQRPEETLELFERYLPHAIALDAENQWAERFEDALTREDQPPPSWWVGATSTSFTPSGMTSSLGSAMGSSLSSASAAPSSSGGGGGGGGSSGGGGGGGGGGGW